MTFRISLPYRPEKTKIMLHGSKFSRVSRKHLSQSLHCAPQCNASDTDEDSKMRGIQHLRTKSIAHTFQTQVEKLKLTDTRSTCDHIPICDKTRIQMKVFRVLYSRDFPEWGMVSVYYRDVWRTQEAKEHANVKGDEEWKWWNFPVAFEDIVPKCSYHKCTAWWGHSQTTIKHQKSISTFQKPRGIPSQAPPHLLVPVILTMSTPQRNVPYSLFLMLVEREVGIWYFLQTP